MEIGIEETHRIRESESLAEQSRHDRGIRGTIHAPRGTFAGRIRIHEDRQTDPHPLDLTALSRKELQFRRIDVTPVTVTGDEGQIAVVKIIRDCTTLHRYADVET